MIYVLFFFRQLVTKVSYILKYNGTSLRPNDIMSLRPSLLQGAMAASGLSQKYSVLEDSYDDFTVQEDLAVEYDRLFSVLLGIPPLDVDRDAFQRQLQQAWIEFKNGNLKSVNEAHEKIW